MSLEAVAASASRGLLEAHDRCRLLSGPIEVSVDALADT